MAAKQSNVSKGRIVQWVINGDTFKACIFKTSEALTALQDYELLSTLLAAGGGASNVECTGYTRPTLSGLTATLNHGSNSYDFDSDDILLGAVAAQTSNAPTTVCCVYKHVAGGDANCIPATFHDWVVIPDGSVLTAGTASGIFSAID